MINKLLSKTVATSAVIVATTGLITLSASESKAVIIGFNPAVGAVSGAYSSGQFVKAIPGVGGTNEVNPTINSSTLILRGFTEGNGANDVLTTSYNFNVTGLVQDVPPAPVGENSFSFTYSISDPDGAAGSFNYTINGTPTLLAGTGGTLINLPLNGATTTSIGFSIVSSADGITNAPVLTITGFSAPGTPVPTPPQPPATAPEPSAVLGLAFLLGAGTLSKARRR